MSSPVKGAIKWLDEDGDHGRKRFYRVLRGSGNDDLRRAFVFDRLWARAVRAKWREIALDHAVFVAMAALDIVSPPHT